MQSQQRTSLLIIEEQDLLRQGLLSIFENQDEFTVVGSSATTEQVIDKIEDLHPQIIVLGLNQAGHNGNLCSAILKHSDTKILLLCPPGMESSVANAFRNGASACLLTDVMASDLLEAMRVIAKGQMVIPQNMARQTLVERRVRHRQTPKISLRELEVLFYLLRLLEEAGDVSEALKGVLRHAICLSD